MTASDDARPAALQQEWLLLQGQHESYELWALIIKLAAVALLAFAPASTASLAVLLLSLWVMEAVLKTFQSRLGERLLRIETLLRRPADGGAGAMQLHSEWQAARPGTTALLAAYLRAGCRPTVAFPYPVLIALLLLLG
jgi:hypothetical protein